MAETLAFAALAAFLVLPDTCPPIKSARMRPYPQSNRLTMIKVRSIRLVFAEDMTTRELSDLLRNAKAQIRQGPSEVGSFTVEVEFKEEKQSLSVLRSHPKVLFTQLVE